MKSAVTICLVPEARRGPFVFHDGLDDGCAKAAAVGFDAVEIFPPAASAIDIAELQGLLDQHSLKLAAVGTGAGWLLHQWSLTHPQPEARSRARDFIQAIIDLAAGFGAPAIVGSMQGRIEKDIPRELALGWLASAMEALGEHAGQHGQVLLYEPLNRYETNLFNTLEGAGAWLRGLKTANVRLLADLFHMNIEETSIPDAILAAGELLGHVHLADSNRHAAGFGHTDIPSAFRALKAISYSGYVSAEIFPFPEPDRAALQTIETIRINTSSC
jgi:sugar phosphate isomerase/epimerase